MQEFACSANLRTIKGYSSFSTLGKVSSSPSLSLTNNIHTINSHQHPQFGHFLTNTYKILISTCSRPFVSVPIYLYVCTAIIWFSNVPTIVWYHNQRFVVSFIFMVPCIVTLYNKIQRNATVCRCLFTVKLLYMFRVSIAPIMRSTSNCNCSFWYRSQCQSNNLPPAWPLGHAGGRLLL